MATTTIGVKVDEAVRGRLKDRAQELGRTPHALLKQAILDLLGEGGSHPSAAPAAPVHPDGAAPFLDFAREVQPQSVLRAAVTAAYRMPETQAVPLLLAQADLPPATREKAKALARDLVAALREKGIGKGVEALIHEFALSSQEGVALMCLAEALLRIPDRPTRDALIRDKIAKGQWQAHLGHSPSLFVNAAAWGLLITGKLVATHAEAGLSAALARLIGKGGEPLIRKGLDTAMRMMGEQFVTGQTIADALANSRRMEARGFLYSYDMLGEAALTAADADRYMADYERAIHAIGKASAGRGIYEGPGISIKLSALHPRYSRAQAARVTAELLPRLASLAKLARRYDIGLNIDAEEADRQELSLDLLEALCFDPELAGWNGVGFVVQAYQIRTPRVIDFVIDLARRSGHRLMIRLVKGAYWDSEIKRAQVDGLEGFPVYTRKIHTDVAYIACAAKLLGAPDAVFPQFATHNAQTLATIYHMAGGNYYRGQYEFQCLHGMGEPLYEEVVGRNKLNRPCRIYAPVGTHETLLAYLVRRLLENGANTSFVNRIADPAVGIDDLTADPVDLARAVEPLGAPHPRIAQPRDLYGEARRNSAGLDLSNEQRLASLASALLAASAAPQEAAPLLDGETAQGTARAVLNPADRRDVVGSVVEAAPEIVERAVACAAEAAPVWASTPPAERAACLARAADQLEARLPALLGVIVREAGKTFANAVGEVREAVDFLRYYGARAAAELSNDTHRPLGIVACISPWNFPLAIFTGQVAAALAAGNAVLAKPAEETPLIAAAAVRILREAGVPQGALQLLPGDGTVGAQLVADPRVGGVVFTGSTQVAKAIEGVLAGRLSPEGRPVPLIAETGGQNALVVDSSALAEQVVADVVASAFDSAGQRCSALRVLCLQEEAADHVLTMLKGAMAELSVGTPDRLSVDVGPVITEEARANIAGHVEAMAQAGFAVHQAPLPEACAHGTFVPPTLIEIERFDQVPREVFGPVLHVLRYRRDDLAALIDAVNAGGWGLTFGVHSRIDETIDFAATRSGAGNIYVNRNLIGAVVGVQPFGGHGLSGTGPKAGGPLYLDRFLGRRPPRPAQGSSPALDSWCAVLDGHGLSAEAARFAALPVPAAAPVDLPGPVGERNTYTLGPRGTVLARAETPLGVAATVAAALAAGNEVVLAAPEPVLAALGHPWKGLPVKVLRSLDLREPFDAALFEGDSDALRDFCAQVAALPGPVRIVQGLPRDALAAGEEFDVHLLALEKAVSVNTAAAGGNASLMTIG